ncbi:1602_t:CDS:2 [Paraglomus occultum]|uniref:1602_t:CDS:1 n=1 Tax=Paraglomus occultum TaxID=144539 RepID=A0A9N8ZNB7_9GLOM|nr:1602_t:CDS:2 [Paraglomus occultum]
MEKPNKLSRILEAIQSSFSSGSDRTKNRKQSFASDTEVTKPQSLPHQNTPFPEELLTLDDIKDEDPCYSCPDPCSLHAQYPRFLRIDRDSPLEGTVKPYIKHVAISTGKEDWSKHIEDAEGLASTISKLTKGELNKSKSKKTSPDSTNNNQSDQQARSPDSKRKPRIIITNCSRKSNSDIFSTTQDVMLFPEYVLIRNLSVKQANRFFQSYLSVNTQPAEVDENAESIISSEKITNKAIIFICSHGRRDKRCGITAPLLRNEFEKVLKEKKLDVQSRSDGVAVYMSSHVGGHKFAGNIIIYRDGQGIWYGRVSPCHCKAIIEKTVIEGKVIKDLYRGSINGSSGTDTVSTSAKRSHISMMDIDQDRDRIAKRMREIKAPSKMANLSEFPSLQKEIQLRCDRPNQEYLAKPVVLYNPIFDQFLAECVDASVTDQFYGDVATMCLSMSDFFPDEHQRRRVFVRHFEGLLGMKCQPMMHSENNSSNDGAIVYDFLSFSSPTRAVFNPGTDRKPCD